MQTAVNTVAGVVGAIINYMFGGWNDLVQLFMLAVFLDYVTGVSASVKTGAGLNSDKGFWGIWKKGLMMLIVMIGHRVDAVLGTELFMAGFIYFYLANELISITENCGRLGLPIPDRIRKMIEILREKS